MSAIAGINLRVFTICRRKKNFCLQPRRHYLVTCYAKPSGLYCRVHISGKICKSLQRPQHNKAGYFLHVKAVNVVRACLNYSKQFMWPIKFSFVEINIIILFSVTIHLFRFLWKIDRLKEQYRESWVYWAIFQNCSISSRCYY